MSFKHHCVQREVCWITTQPDWGIIFGPKFFAGRCDPSDADGIVELNGYFLTLEWKNSGVPLTEGQSRMFDQRIRTGIDTVFVIWGPVNNPAQIQIWNAGGRGMRETCSLGRLRSLGDDWWRRVTNLPSAGGGANVRSPQDERCDYCHRPVGQIHHICTACRIVGTYA